MQTETVDPRFVDIDRWPTAVAVAAMFEGQLAAIAAVAAQVAPIAEAAEAAAARLGDRGRLAYVGAGTSGRIAVQDGAELHPTYNWPQDRLVFLMAGGLAALTEAAEGAEDDADAGRAAIAGAAIGADDVVIGVAASGRTPYTVAAIDAAGAAGALTIAIANNAGCALLALADHGLVAVTGTEVIAGSTRMKAGTAQKAMLNLLSTAIMLRQGRIHRGLMVNMRISNDKLRQRGEAMVRDLAGVDTMRAAQALDAAGQDIKLAVLLALGAAPDAGRQLLDRHSHDLTRALTAWRAEARHA
ncbi:N-acetylmuramic acid 6-phosphate etherase [Polymorphobacter fuscus]|uniref:N-acetylmuramic acid 6-phosphate etherase n=1 Tax=Sandarakinorhabdus fusca TaxID=1439888 RepID=A0A7C9KX80_9SPHN|nr:N-acetylmuramic acid 6-phosphate etherase [Polymorphobacter fuscus]KAB7647936.1 N-acetylmuramic acid 6-phosphate etherase [Polymorphobacter fuscus]MQT17262.1 N-acetylmuramic acid 6-phosphate etherase [Polymorphobacter fuscus]NJC08743.1 N-acetylmuramic acid 6-phosphate etherase [Polymorphobacter fuscus]